MKIKEDLENSTDTEHPDIKEFYKIYEDILLIDENMRLLKAYAIKNNIEFKD